VLGGNGADELHDDDGLAHAGAAEQADFPALGIGGEQVDDLDAGVEDLFDRELLLERGRGPVDGFALIGVGQGRAAVDGVAQQIEQPPQALLAHGHRDGAAGVLGGGAPDHPVGGIHGHRPDHVVAQVLGHLDHQGQLAVRSRDVDGVEDPGQVVLVELDVHHRSDDLANHPAFALRLHEFDVGAR
jgi:peptide chain release factor 1